MHHNHSIVPGPPSEAERRAVAHVKERMDLADADLEADRAEQQDRAAENAEWAQQTDGGADGSYSPSTRRILEQWNANRTVDDHAADEEALAGLPGGESEQGTWNTKKAVKSVAAILRGQRPDDDEDALYDEELDEDGEPRSAISPENYNDYDAECAADFPSEQDEPVVQAPERAPAEADDGFYPDGTEGDWLRTASAPPSFNPHG